MCELCKRTVENFSGRHKYMDGFSMCAKMAEVEIGFISVHTKQSQGNH